MVVMGIDPGSRITGYGVIQGENQNNLQPLGYGCIRFGPHEEFYQRLKKIYDEIAVLIDIYHPDHIAFEDVFYSRNIKVAFQLGQARGAAILSAINRERSVFTYAPKEVKQALTGYGGASKEQVREMVIRVLYLKSRPSPLDVSDALAIATCHLYRNFTQERLGSR